MVAAKADKAARINSIQFLISTCSQKDLCDKGRTWLAKLFTKIIGISKLPKIWRTAKVIALTKPDKTVEDTVKKLHAYIATLHSLQVTGTRVTGLAIPGRQSDRLPEQGGFP